MESVEVRSRAEWRRWLTRHHGRDAGIWVVYYRKHVEHLHVPYADLVEEALCFGWVDSKPRTVDADRTGIWFAPRKKGSAWSRLNKDRVARLTRAGRMHAAGLAKVRAAKADGSWSALDEVEAMVVPRDLAAALRRRPGAAAHFERFPGSAKRGILQWIASARRPETRAKRVEETASLAERNVRANQWKRQ